MDAHMKDNGVKIKCKGKDITHGLMEEHIKESISLIKSMDLEFIHGLMGEFMKAHGAKVNNMAKADIQTNEVKSELGFGRMENA